MHYWQLDFKTRSIEIIALRPLEAPLLSLGATAQGIYMHIIAGMDLSLVHI